MSHGRLAAAGLALAALAAAGCGGDADSARVPAPTADEQAVIREAEQAAAARAADRQEAAIAEAAAAERRKVARRAKARDAKRGDELLSLYIARGTRDRWSVMDVSVLGGTVTVHTDLPPTNAAAFLGACGQLVAAGPWIETVRVVGTDGGAHGTWSRGDAECAPAASG